MRKKLLSVVVFAAAEYTSIFCIVKTAYDYIELKKADKRNLRHNDAKRCMTRGCWINDDDDSIYNCYGDRVGFLKYDWKDFEEKD